MPWPQSTDYNLAIQTPSLCFRDEELRVCTAYSADPVLGLPTPRSGNFADVYRMDHPAGHSWAVKCFTREVGDLQERYAAISEHLQRANRSFIVEFRYLPDAMLVDGVWYPIVKMRWVEGKNLSEFVSEQADRPVLFDKLAAKWLKLAAELRETHIGHGDLQHGNVLLVPNPQRGTFFLRLIDYDGMYVPALANRPSRECGYPGYQHPLRPQRNLFGPEIDRFSHLVIFTALRAIRAGGGALWRQFGSPENLLFSDRDFTAPAESELLRTLFALPDPHLRHLVGHLVLAALDEPDRTPLLQTIAPQGQIQRLDVPQYERLRQALGSIITPMRRTRVEVPAGSPPPAVPVIEEIPPLPGPLQQPRTGLGNGKKPPAEVPVARRINDTSSLPDWMLPEAVPLEEARLTQTADEDDSDPDLPPLAVPLLAVPPLVAIPVPPVDREPPPFPLLRPVLLEETPPRAVPIPRVEPLPENFDPPVAEEILDVVEVAPEDEPPPAALPPPPRRPLEPEPPDEILDALPDETPAGRSVVFGLILVGVGLLVMGGLVALVVTLLRRDPQGPPPPRAACLRPFPEVEVMGGQETLLRVDVDPGDTGQRDFEVRLVGIPASLSVQVRPPALVAEKELPPAQFRLTAPLDVVATSTTASVQLHRGNVLIEEKPLSVTVRRPDFPQFVTPLPRTTFRVGGNRLLDLTIDRKGRNERLEVQFENVPAGIKISNVPVEPGKNRASANCTVPPRQPLGSERIVARLLLKPDDARQPQFEVHRATFGMDIAPAIAGEILALARPTEETKIPAGSTVEFRVQIRRSAYSGALRLRIPQPPAGVTTEETDVLSSHDSGVFLLRAAADAPIGATFSLMDIEALEGAEVIGRIRARVRVVPALPLTMPPVMPPRPMPMLPQPRGSGEGVTLTTGDGVKLGATFYAAVRKPGETAAPPCFLLLHDRGLSRKDVLHQLMAESLQSAGYAVLTFDFRGHGDSTETLPGFETHPGNALVARRAAERKRLDEADFPPEYLPVLLNDILAARTYLDGKSDRQEIHGNLIFLLGVGEGASLGLLWLGSETCRGEGENGKGQPESRSIVGGFWLNPKSAIPDARADRCLKLLARETPAGHTIYRPRNAGETSWAGPRLRDILSNPRDADLAPLNGTDLERKGFFDSLAADAKRITEAIPALIRRRNSRNLAFAWVIPQPSEGTHPAKESGQETARPLPLVPLGLLAP